MPYLARAILLSFMLLLAACGGAQTSGIIQPTLAAPTTTITPSPATPVPTQPSAPSAAPAPTQPSAPSATPAPTQPAASTAPPAPTVEGQISGDVLVIYHKSGGFVGIDETLTVHADGKLDLLTRRGGNTTAQVDPADLSVLRKLLASAEFASLQPPAPPPGADQYVYELTVPGTGRRIMTVDGAQNPPVLDQAIDELEQLRARVKTGGGS
jgi:hypothetical protein